MSEEKGGIIGTAGADGTDEGMAVRGGSGGKLHITHSYFRQGIGDSGRGGGHGRYEVSQNRGMSAWTVGVEMIINPAD